MCGVNKTETKANKGCFPSRSISKRNVRYGENGFGREIVEDMGDNGVVVPSNPIILTNLKPVGLETVARLWNIVIGNSIGESNRIPRPTGSRCLGDGGAAESWRLMSVIVPKDPPTSPSPSPTARALVSKFGECEVGSAAGIDPGLGDGSQLASESNSLNDIDLGIGERWRLDTVRALSAEEAANETFFVTEEGMMQRQ